MQPKTLTVGEKLIVSMLCELYRALKINSDIDPAFGLAAIRGGHLWALKMTYERCLRGRGVSLTQLRSIFWCRSRSRAACATDTPRSRTNLTASSLNSRLKLRRPIRHLQSHHDT